MNRSEFLEALKKLMADKPPDLLRGVFSMRFINDERPWDSPDRETWYEFVVGSRVDQEIAHEEATRQSEEAREALAAQERRYRWVDRIKPPTPVKD